MRKLLVSALFLCVAAAPSSSDEHAIRAMYDRFSAAVQSHDIHTIMSFYAPDVVAFDAFPPRQYSGAAAYRKDYEGFFAAFPGPVTSKASDVHVNVSGNIAYAYGVDTWTVTGKDGQAMPMVFRFTDVLRRAGGKWLIVHEHLSFPVDPDSGKADFSSKP